MLHYDTQYTPNNPSEQCWCCHSVINGLFELLCCQRPISSNRLPGVMPAGWISWYLERLWWKSDYRRCITHGNQDMACPHSSRYAASLRLTLSSLAIRLRGPQRAFTASSFAFSDSTFSSDTSQHRRTNREEQLNLLASFALVQFSGSFFLNLFISAIFSSVKWFLWNSGRGRICGGRSASEELVGANNWRRGSSLGRNEYGVWRGFNADEGGLNMIRPCCSCLPENTNEASGLTFSFFFVRRLVASYRFDMRLTGAMAWGFRDRRSHRGRRNNRNSIAAWSGRCNCWASRDTHQLVRIFWLGWCIICSFGCCPPMLREFLACGAPSTNTLSQDHQRKGNKQGPGLSSDTRFPPRHSTLKLFWVRSFFVTYICVYDDLLVLRLPFTSILSVLSSYLTRTCAHPCTLLTP